MKKTATLLFALMLTLLLAVTAQAENVQTVHTVDEFIAAVAPNTEIHLAEGTFLLSEASTYGERTGNPYVRWEGLYGDTYTLSIHDVENLTIIGSGRDKTELLTQRSDADVLEFMDCVDVTLRDFTGGHTPQADGCAAGVIRLFRSDNVTMNGLGLFGCGAVGVNAERAKYLTMEDCEIYDCSMSGMYITECSQVLIRNCSINHIGKTLDGWNTGYVLFSIDNSMDVMISDCEMTQNTTSYLFSMWESLTVCLSNNRITDNSATYSVFLLQNSSPIFDSGNVFEDNTFSHWYNREWEALPNSCAYDENGEALFTEDPAPLHVSSDPVESVPVITGEQKQVRVSTVDEFLAAIASDTEIILTEEFYDLSTASDYGKYYNRDSQNYYWEEEFDGPALVITGVENFSIVTEDDTPSLHVLSAVPRYANVLSFRECRNVMLRGFTAGHTVEPGSCAGGVLQFEVATQNVLVENCDLYGCGILGVMACDVNGLQVVNSCIYECSYGGIECYLTNDITVGGCQFWDLGGPTFQLSGCTNVTIDGQTVAGDYYGN